jgi:hypothetical protein
MRHQLLEIAILIIGRRAPAQMQLNHLPILVEQRGLHLGLLPQPRQIGLGACVIGGDDAVAAAIKAHGAAERQMQIQGQRARDEVLIARLGLQPIVRIGHGWGKLQRGGIRGVARPVDVVFVQQIGIEHGGHGDTCSFWPYRGSGYPAPSAIILIYIRFCSNCHNVHV